MEHKNLFDYAGSKQEVYAAFDKHYRRDIKVLVWLQFATGVLFVLAFRAGVAEGFGWLLLGLGTLATATNYFIDNSNRNWAMHVIDWIEASKEN